MLYQYVFTWVTSTFNFIDAFSFEYVSGTQKTNSKTAYCFTSIPVAKHVHFLDSGLCLHIQYILYNIL